MTVPANRCRDLFASPAGPRCELPTGHHGPHAAHVLWGAHLDDDAPTAKLPPIRDTVRRRPPAPEVRELADRAELLEALGRELQRELRELLDTPDCEPDCSPADLEQIAADEARCRRCGLRRPLGDEL